MYKYRITVFTPTYNRAYTLGKLFQSLCNQTFKNFEWLIVDDGSTDETEALVSEWRVTTKFDISYYKTVNGGKHRAVNYGLQKACGELFFTMDSDDELTVDALEKIDKWFESIVDKKDICGVAANKGLSLYETPNKFFKATYLDKSWYEVNTYQENGKNVLDGERAIIFYTDFHRKYPFPEIVGEKFLTEAVVYNQIARDGYKIRFYNDIIWIYEYLDDGLTKAGILNFIKNPKGYALWLKGDKKYVYGSFFQKTKILYIFMCDLSDHYTTKQIAEYFNTAYFKVKLLDIVRKLKRLIH